MTDIDSLVPADVAAARTDFEVTAKAEASFKLRYGIMKGISCSTLIFIVVVVK
jgi:hypothetical protein